MDFILAGILGLIGGVVGLTDSLIGDTKAENFLNETYADQKEEARLRYEQAKEEAERNADRADLQADLADQGQNVAEQTLSNDFNTAIDNMYLGQQSDTMEWNNAAMQMGSSQGASYAGLAASGVRAGSSLSDAVLMESATNEAQLQFAQDAKRRSDNNNLASVLNNLAGNKLGIYQNRVGADQTREDALYLRNSFKEGGYNYNLYQNQLKQMQTKHDYEIDQHTGWNKALNALGGFFGMGAKGFSTGYDLYDTYKKGSAYKTKLGGEE